ncbi:MAG: prepilin-type N-terminal cleavage/methylation domain-containing protein [Akkermansiaceae bacterium]|nr:prepilin-type N-terminal cleavage/methylation domain-containing protein [Akkermansiaceae bacterium]
MNAKFSISTALRRTVRSSERAFSFVEVLTVVLLIGVVASIGVLP